MSSRNYYMKIRRLVFSILRARIAAMVVLLVRDNRCNVVVVFSVFLTKVLTILRCLHFPDARFDVANHSSFWCKLLQYLSDLFSDYSTCLIFAFTVERSIAAYLPTQFKRVSISSFPRLIY